MKVLAVGAAGPSAGLVVRALSARGISVRGLVQSLDRSGAARANGASEVVVADLNDRESLERAVQGVDGVFHVIPAFVPDEAATGVALVEVAAAAGVDRFVFSSVYHPSLTDLSNHRDKQPAEQAIYDSDMDFVILQPAMFMAQLEGVARQAERSGVISGPYSPASRMAYVDYRDVADVAALSFAQDSFLGGTFELASPGLFSRDDLAATLTELLGKPVRAEGAVPRLPRDGQMPDSMRLGLEKMFSHYDEHGFHGGNALVLEHLLGRRATSVRDYLSALVVR